MSDLPNIVRLTLEDLGSDATPLENFIEQQQARIAELESQLKEEKNIYKTTYNLMLSGEKRGVEKATEELQPKIDELAATVERLRELFNNASGDIQRLFELQPQNLSDGSYEVDGQSVTELGLAFQATPHQNLNAVKREVLEDLIRNVDTLGDNVQIVSVNSNWLRKYANQRYPDKE